MAAMTTDQASAGAPAGPQPRSPPAYPDLCGRHRLQVEVQLLTREIGVLQDELQSVEGFQSVSSCCKETKKRDRRCCFRRWLRTLFCFNITWICCSGRCSRRLKRPSCGGRNLSSRCCHSSKYGCPCSSNCCKFSYSSCRSCCSLPRISCPEYSCGCVWSCSKCTEVCLCTKRSSCCKSQCLCQWT